MTTEERNNYMRSLEFVCWAGPQILDAFATGDLHKSRALINETNIILTRIHARLCHEIDKVLP